MMIKDILQLSGKVKNICINLPTYHLLDKSDPLFDPSTIRDLLKNGIYGKVANIAVYCSIAAPPHHFLISNLEYPIIKSAGDWSAPIPLQFVRDIDKILKLKAFS